MKRGLEHERAAGADQPACRSEGGRITGGVDDDIELSGKGRHRRIRGGFETERRGDRSAALASDDHDQFRTKLAKDLSYQ